MALFMQSFGSIFSRFEFLNLKFGANIKRFSGAVEDSKNDLQIRNDLLAEAKRIFEERGEPF